MADMYAGGSASFDEKTGMRKMNPTQAERMAARAARRKAEDARDAARKAARAAGKVSTMPVKPKREEKMTRAARQAALAAKRKTRSGAMITGGSSTGATGMTY